MLGCFSKLKRTSSISTTITKPSFYAAAAAAGNPAAAVFNNFNSLYEHTSDSDTPTGSSSKTLTLASTSCAGGDCGLDEPDPISSAIASHRLFSASPGRSNSIVDSAAVSVGTRGSGLAVPTYSPDPYWDFRRSMEEMVAALGFAGGHLDFSVLRDLLLCYLAINPKHAHKYIVTAFADLLLALSAAGDVRRSGDC